MSLHGLGAKEIKTLRALVDGQLNVPAAEAVAQSIGRESAVQKLLGETLFHSRNGTNVIKASNLRLPPVAPKRKKSGKSNWPSPPAERAKVLARCAERKAMGEPKRVGVAEAYEAINRLRKAVENALSVELESVPPRAVVKMIDTAGGGALLKSKPGRKVVRVAIHEDTPLVALLSADDDPARVANNRLMKPGPRHRSFHAATCRLRSRVGDFKRTIDFYIGSDAEEEELSGDEDDGEESEGGEEQAESGNNSE